MNASKTTELSTKQLRLLGHMVDGAMSPISVYDISDAQKPKVVYANDAARTRWPTLYQSLEEGLSYEASVAAEVRDIMPEAPDDLVRQIAKTFVDDFTNGQPYEMRTRDHQWFKSLHKKVGNGLLTGIAVDVTELKQRETDIKRAEAKFQNAFDAFEFGVIINDANGIITYFNKAYKDYSNERGIDVQLGMHVKDYIKIIMEADGTLDDYTEAEIDEYVATTFNQQDKHEAEVRLPDGRYVLRRRMYHPSVGNISTVTDITEIKRQQLKAQEAERAKSDFLATMSHEIRTPMNGVLGMVDLLSRCDLGPKERKFVDTIARSGDALLTIINDILDFSRIEAGRLELDVAPFDIRDSVDDVAGLLAGTATEKDVALMVDVASDVAQTYQGDAGRVRQILINLVGNAIKFTPAGHVFIKVQRSDPKTGRGLIIQVQDTGIGIPADNLATIFEKFKQVDGTRSRKFEGTGLGLAITAQLATLMGGGIEVQSVEGEGSTFTVTLDLEAQDKSGMEMFPAVQGRKILFVHQNPIACEVFQEHFKDQKASLVSVDTLEVALRVLKLAQMKSMQIDALIIDGRVPGEADVDRLKLLRQDPAFTDLKILMLTSIAKGDYNSPLLDLDLDAYLTRPVGFRALLECLTDLWTTPHAPQRRLRASA